MKLSQLIDGLDILEIKGDTDIEIMNIAYDSRKVSKGSLFVCIEGFISDGHNYISQAIEAGAAAVMVQKDSDVCGAAYVKVRDTRIGLAHVSNVFFDHPSSKFKLIGITGTKGKTTASFMTRSIFNAAGQKTALIGTITNMIEDKVVYTSRTTPESYDLQSFFDDCARAGVESCIMEVSSQGLSLNRVYGCEYDTGVFTNFYNDHIAPGEHVNLQEYLEAKAMLFDMVKNAVVNIDADKSPFIIDRAKSHQGVPLYTIGLSDNASVSATDLIPVASKERIGTGFHLESPWYKGQVFVGMPGRFNVYNALCAIACAGIAGLPFDAIVSGLESITVKGRIQPVITNRDFQVIVDYAHNAASLESLLATMRESVPGRLICVFGCGGDRAKSRRFEMGEVSGRLSDLTVITSDNPRTEDPESILADIETGVKKTNGGYIKFQDRTEAIGYAIKNAKSGDMVIIAGKGHENYQMFADRTIHYDDAEVAEKILDEM
ncbi:MAG: UDP-N-acetylmuramoyl-L-alanyl-D-glutamate--2,6-diaminopimelate ligase [Saccharofermentanales bacterium]